MRLLIYSDVHGNWPAVQALAAAIAGQYDQAACLGDVVGYGGEPNRVAEWVRANAAVVVRGNHDRAAAALDGIEEFNTTAARAARWTHENLEPDLRAWLTALPAGPLLWHDLLLAHGSPLDEDVYIVDLEGAAEALLAPPMRAHRLLWVGHTHLQLAFSAAGERVTPIKPELPSGSLYKPASWTLELEPAHRYLLNPGSIGQPRDGDRRAAFAIYDDATPAVTFHRIPYNIAAAQASIEAAGLPHPLATRLHQGR